MGTVSQVTCKCGKQGSYRRKGFAAVLCGGCWLLALLGWLNDKQKKYALVEVPDTDRTRRRRQKR